MTSRTRSAKRRLGSGRQTHRGRRSSRRNGVKLATYPLDVLSGLACRSGLSCRLGRLGELQDSFHFPNCAPQHENFNQNDRRSGIWWRVEDWCAALGTTGKICLVNGPVFDAPRSKKVNGEWRLRPNDDPDPDPVYGGVSIPKQFFKIAAFEDLDGNLAIQAFVVTQEAVLAATAAIEEALDERELRLYRVNLPIIEKLTGMDLGPLVASAASVNEIGTDGIERITGPDQL